MVEYVCKECGEVFEYRQHCIIHALEWKHQNFEMPSTDIQIVIKPV